MAPSQVTAWSLGIVLVFTLLELRTQQFRHDSFVDRQRRRRNWTYFVASFLPMQVIHAVTPSLERMIPSILSANHVVLPLIWELIVCLLIADLISWCSHYLKHRVSFLWRFHFQHHREERFSIWLVTHTHALEVTITGLCVAFALTAVGVSLEARQIYLLLYSASVLYHHSAHPYSLGWLDWIFVSPAYHRLHHEVQSEVNYGAVLTLFDVLFGTARWPDKQVAPRPYGLDAGSDEPFGFWNEMTWFLRWPGRRRSPLRDVLTDRSQISKAVE